MVSTKRLLRPFTLFVRSVWFVVLIWPSAAQQPGREPSSLAGAELGELEKVIAAGTPAERYAALRRQARIFELAGNLEGAADAWTAAAAPNSPDNEQALYRAALCRAALGDWERAGETVKNLLIAGRDPVVRRETRRLGAQIEAFSTGNTAALEALLSDPGFAACRPSLLFSLWRLAGADVWKRRLLAEYPASPEARIASGDGAGNTVVTQKAAAIWFLFPGRESVTLEGGSAAAVPPPATPALTGGPSPAARGSLLQTGLYGKEANAREQAAALKDAGFGAEITTRQIKGASYWAVVVNGGDDTAGMMRRLKAAGFDSFPLQ